VRQFHENFKGVFYPGLKNKKKILILGYLTKKRVILNALYTKKNEHLPSLCYFWIKIKNIRNPYIEMVKKQSHATVFFGLTSVKFVCCAGVH
jgi:hypothetical protein